MTEGSVFETIRKIDPNGVEYWEARQLQPVLEYKSWRNFEPVIKKAITACQNSDQIVENHFAQLRKMVSIGYETQKTGRELKDYKLSRYACYLIAQNGDPKKDVIAKAQTSFASNSVS